MLNKSKLQNELYINKKKEIDKLSQTKQIGKAEYDKRIKELISADRKLSKEQGSFGKFVGKYYIKFKQLSIPMIVLILFGVACSLMLPLMTQQMSFGIARKFGFGESSKQDWGLDWQVSMWIAIGVTIFNLVIMFFTQYLAQILSNKVEIELRTEALNSLVKQDISYYSNKKTGEVLTKIISDTQIVGEQTAQVPVTMIQAILTVLGTLGMMFYFDWRLTFIVIGIFVFIIMFMGLFYGMVHKKIGQVRNVVSDINGDVADRINNIRLIKSSGTENHEIERFTKLHKNYATTNRSMVKFTATFMTVMFGGISLLQLGIVIGSVLIYQNDSAGAFVFFSSTFASFTLALSAMVGSLFQTVMVSVGIAKGSVSAARVNQIIAAKPLIDIYQNLENTIDTIDGDIIFQNVEFAYPEKPGNLVLPNFNFKMEKGKSYAIVGGTGAGKSTIAKLLLRYYDPTSGNIFINNNQNLREINLTSYLKHVGYVEQEPSILYGNVFDNVRYGKFDATEEQIVAACQKAELDDLVKSWPEGYHTILGERGMMLSGGQKQRLVIARMFLKDPNLLILDEATSALDNIVEKEIQQQLNKLMQGRTTVSIAHRLSTIEDADQIIVLGSDGQGIVQVGTFDELKQTPGHFKNLYDAGLMR